MSGGTKRNGLTLFIVIYIQMDTSRVVIDWLVDWLVSHSVRLFVIRLVDSLPSLFFTFLFLVRYYEIMDRVDIEIIGKEEEGAFWCILPLQNNKRVQKRIEVMRVKWE